MHLCIWKWKKYRALEITIKILVQRAKTVQKSSFQLHKGVKIIYEVEFNFFKFLQFVNIFLCSINVIEKSSFNFSVSKSAKCNLENFCLHCVLQQAGIIDFLTQYGHLPASFNSFSLGAIPFLTFPMLCPVNTVQDQIFRWKTQTRYKSIFALCNTQGQENWSVFTSFPSFSCFFLQKKLWASDLI